MSNLLGLKVKILAVCLLITIVASEQKVIRWQSKLLSAPDKIHSETQILSRYF